MSKRLLELEILFDVYNRSLQVLLPRATDTFVCPVCMNPFGKEDIYNGNLSVEHVPPESIKTVYKTMTCTRCNNSIGSKLQRFMVNDVRRKELEAGIELKEPFPAEVSMAGFRFDTAITSAAGRTWKAVSPLSILPPNLKRLEAARKIAGNKASISLKGLGTREVLDRAYLHSSYLALFSLLGYPYIMQPFMEGIRQQINKGQPLTGARISFPSWAKRRIPFFDPRERKIEVSLIGTAPKPDESCFAIYVAGELVLMPFTSDHHKVIRSEFDLILSESAANARKHLPFHIRLMEIDPSCKYSARYVFEKGSHVGDVTALRLSPVMETNGTG